MSSYNDIFRIVHEQVSIKDLVPLTNILTEEDKVNYQKQGYYLVQFTLSEFEERFENVDSSKIYFSNKMSMLNPMYIDLDKFICVGLPLMGFGDEKDDDDVFYMINLVLDAYLNEDYSRLLNLSPSPLKMELFMNMINSNKIKNPYELFVDVYTGLEYNFDKFSIDFITDIYNKRTESELLDFKFKIKDLPDEVIIYRGEGDIRRDFETCYSWTLDENIANFFALKHAQNKARILKGVISKDDILDYLLDRNEEEILVNPINIRNLEIKELKSISSVDPNYLGFAQTALEDDRDLINDLYDKLQTKTHSHDKDHTKRVLILAALICCKTDLKFYMMDNLFTSIVFHDVGRDNDDTDTKHGRNAIPIYLKFNEDKTSEVVKFLIEYHCIDDDIACKYIEENFDEVDKDQIKLAYSILKDADALDRVRFGIRELDISYLRNKESKDLIFVAQQLLHYKFL